MNDHESGFLAFLAEPTKRRMQSLLELGEARRRDVRELLHHSVRLDLRFCVHLKGSDAFSGPAETMLRKKGAPSVCYVLSANSDLDGREMSLAEALDRTLGMSNGTFISCIPGRLGLYEYADVKSSYLLSR